jgi:LemA protein
MSSDFEGVRKRRPVWITCLVILGVLVVIGGCCGIGAFGWIRGGYNRAIALNEDVNAKWAQVENQLQRRNDLIPNLVETVKGYAKHERELFENIANARTKYFQAQTRADKIAAADNISTLLSRLLVLRETYPQLKANESFLKLQDSLEGTENRLAVERMRYNEAVRALNTYHREFFGRYFCNWAGVKEAEYFKAPEEAKKTPQVKF